MVVTALTVTSRLVLALREVLVARSYGTSQQADAFFVALLVPSLLAVAVVSGLQLAVVPALVMRAPSSQASLRILDRLIGWVVVALGTFTVVCVVCAGPLISILGSAFDASTAQMAVRLFRIIAPIVVLAGLSGAYAGCLSAVQRVVAVAVSQVANAAAATALFVVARDRFGLDSLALGVLVGAASEVVVLRAFWRRHTRRERSSTTQDGVIELSSVLIAALPLVLATILSSANSVFDQAVAASRSAGSVSSLGYASKLVLFAAIPLASLGIAAYPRLAQLATADPAHDLPGLLRHTLVATSVAGLALTAVLVALAGPLVHVLLSRGAFDEASVEAVAGPLRAYSLMLPAYGANIVVSRVFIAMGHHRFVLAVGAVNAIVNTAADLMLVHMFGIVGIALATSLVQWACSVYQTRRLSAVLHERRRMAPVVA
jgi:putative peptidoglycan lipid II flippase